MKFFKGSLLIFKCDFYFTIINKTNFLYYKKTLVFCIPKNVFLCVIQPNFSPVVYNKPILNTCTRYLYIKQIFLIQMNYSLQSMYNHMVGRAASFPSPLYSILLDPYPWRISWLWKVVVLCKISWLRIFIDWKIKNHSLDQRFMFNFTLIIEKMIIEKTISLRFRINEQWCRRISVVRTD